MPRQARIVVPDCFHHCVSRGIDRRDLFKSGYDKGRYLRRLNHYAALHQVKVHAYCILDNHFHLILTPTTPTGLAQLFRGLHTWFALRFNRRHKRKGPVFEGRFHSSAMDEPHGLAAMRYVELNPRRAGIPNWLRWLCSSVRANAEARPDRLVTLDRTPLDRRFPTEENWKLFLLEEDPGAVLTIERHLRSNQPLGDPAWLKELEAKHPQAIKKRPTRQPQEQTLRSTA